MEKANLASWMRVFLAAATVAWVHPIVGCGSTAGEAAAGAGAGSDATADAGAESDASAEAGPGSDAFADAGVEPGMDAPADAGVEPRGDASGDAGSEPGSDAAGDAGSELGSDAAADAGPLEPWSCCYCTCISGAYAGKMGYRPQCGGGWDSHDAAFCSGTDPCVPLDICMKPDSGPPICPLMQPCGQ